jgi:hypothetical protein
MVMINEREVLNEAVLACVLGAVQKLTWNDQRRPKLTYFRIYPSLPEL